MAFPTSPSNNQVHKEGNRAFVYDSALGVWDQVRETDRTENKILQGEIGNGVTFPAGVILKVQQFIVGTGTSSINSTAWVQYHTFDYSPHGGANNTSKIICIFHANVESQSDTAEGRSNMKVVVTGDDITNLDDEYAEAWGTYDTSSRTYGGHGYQLRAIQLDGSGKADITFTFSARNIGASSGQGFTVKGGAMAKSSATIFEFEA